MISVSHLDRIKNIKWNETQNIEAEIHIENTGEENENITKNIYEIITNVDERKLANGICNNSYNTNITDFICNENEYDNLEIAVVIILFLLIVVTVIGNTLIISAVVTTKRLRTVTNCFVTSLAVADLLVGIFVMPPAIAVHITGKWELGWILCDIWISLDILLCTASILSLCAISVDRYLAVTRPLTYSRRRRSKKLALTMIFFVWVSAGAITCPPMFGWYEPDHNQGGVCRYNQNPGYVVFSAMGSFFLPMAVMVYVYARISCVVARRHQQLASTNKCSKKGKLSCIKSESDSGSDKLSLRQSASKQPSRNSNQQSDCSTLSEPKCPCCFNAAKKSRQTKNYRDNKERESRFYNEVTFKANFKYKNTGRHRNHSTKDHIDNNRVSSLRRETKTAQTLSLVVGGFVACWLPFFLYYILTPFISIKYVNPVLMYILTWLGWFNSAINPFIYAFYSPDFRLAFWRLTFKKCKRNKR
ncbi:PREDICTED: 5-hydroxytryptamine receptor 2B-like [Papilio xuthus]|uniref:5-hydroxytryptamine receptor 2B-like n=1 Tax=Papilio xuthus TaxID=66420 RepID=A0AAJ7E6Z6_PAPXU|nr:PREDICTED: 5-hydroxytryptamine receptor 2B-like [Papilio xuthus]